MDFVSDFRSLRDERLSLAASHEAVGNYSLAYLALWSVVENFAKYLGPICHEARLKNHLMTWVLFLESGRAGPAPKPIPPATFEIAERRNSSIPHESLLGLVLKVDNAPTFYSLASTKGKYRTKRNRIAHSGESVSRVVFGEFKSAVELCIEEIDRWIDRGMPRD